MHNRKFRQGGRSIDKFKYNASFSGLCPAEKAIAIVKAVNHLEAFKDINDFVESYLLFK